MSLSDILQEVSLHNPDFATFNVGQGTNGSPHGVYGACGFFRPAAGFGVNFSASSIRRPMASQLCPYFPICWVEDPSASLSDTLSILSRSVVPSRVLAGPTGPMTCSCRALEGYQRHSTQRPFHPFFPSPHYHGQQHRLSATTAFGISAAATTSTEQPFLLAFSARPKHLSGATDDVSNSTNATDNTLVLLLLILPPLLTPPVQLTTRTDSLPLINHQLYRSRRGQRLIEEGSFFFGAQI